jgi:hypothetical protein
MYRGRVGDDWVRDVEEANATIEGEGGAKALLVLANKATIKEQAIFMVIVFCDGSSLCVL